MRGLIAAVLIATATPVAAADVIGISLPLSGRFASLGREIEMGMLKAIEDHVSTGGKRPEIALVDDACETEGGRRGLDILRERDARIVIGIPCFEPALVYGDALDVPILALGLRHAKIAEQVEAGRITLLGPTPDAEALAVADLVLPRWRDKPFAIVDDGGVRGRALAEQVRKLGEDRGLKPQQLATFRPLQSTQAALVRRLANAGIEAVFVAGQAEDAATIARDAARLGDLEVATGEDGALVPFVTDAGVTDAGTVPPLLAVARPARRDLPSVAILKERMDARADFASDPFLEGYALAEVALATLGSDRTLRGAAFETVLGELDFSDGRVAPSPFQLVRWTGETLEPVSR